MILPSIRNPSCATSSCGFFFLAARDLAVEVEERCRGGGGGGRERERERCIPFFLGLEIGMKCNK